MPQRKNPDFQQPGVVFNPQAYRGMQRGINQVANLIRPTLGPLPQVVAIEQAMTTKMPELLDDGGTIARRMIMLKKRNEDMGAMYLRHVLWKLHETAGDGTATAAVIFQLIYNEGIRYITAGGNAMRLRYYLEQGLRLIFNQLDQNIIHLRGKQQLTQLANTICYDQEMAKILGEIYDIIGAYGRLELRNGRSREMEREYVEGLYWDSKLFSRAMANDPNLHRAQAENTAILLTNLTAEAPEQLVPLLETAVQAGIKTLFVTLLDITDRAMGILLTKANRDKIQVFAVKIPGVDTVTQANVLEDIAILTGGQPIHREANQTFADVRPENFGHARKIWVDKEYLGIVGGKGDPRKLRDHIAHLREALPTIKAVDDRKLVQQRLSKIISGSATLYVGAPTPLQIESRRALAERTAEAMRGAIIEGVLPGGGTALLGCQAALKAKKAQAENDDERAAYSILIRAVEEPIRTIIHNSGGNPDEVMAAVRQAGEKFGYEVFSHSIMDFEKAGIFDSVSVLHSAVRSAIEGAALALTVDVLIHLKNPPESTMST